jgi:hypothetical protein
MCSSGFKPLLSNGSTLYRYVEGKMLLANQAALSAIAAEKTRLDGGAVQVEYNLTHSLKSNLVSNLEPDM